MSIGDPRRPAAARHRRLSARAARVRAPRRQRGIILVLVLTLVVAAALWGVTSSLTTAALRTDRERATMAAIMQAKEALIAHAASNPSPSFPDRPGTLPCPDRDNDGDADGGAGANCATSNDPNLRVGRLPWKTLDLPDLRDSSGERFWYALSGNFRRSAGTVVNSDTQGQIQLTGLAPGQRVVAVIIAPGAPLSQLGQTRDPAFPAQLVNIANYLEGENDYNNDGGGLNNDVFANASVSSTFNDIVVPITEDELFPVVENMVALRLRKDVKAQIDVEYRDFWGAYPFPAAFNPTTVSPPGYVGVAGATEGQLPVDSDQLAYSWVSAGSDTAFTVISGTLLTNSCSAVGVNWQCDVEVNSPTADVSLNVKALNVGRSFAWYKQTWPVDDNPLPVATSTVSGTLDPTANGNGTVTFRLTLRNGPPTSILLRPPEANPKLTRSTGATTADPSIRWFFRDEWYRLVYYAAAPGALPGGPLACTLNAALATPPCGPPVDPMYLPLDKLKTCPASAPPLPAACLPRVRRDGTREDTGAVLVLAGHAVDVQGTVQSRPTTVLADYLEGARNRNVALAFDPTVPAPFTPREFEQKPRFISSADPFVVNDRVVVLAP